MPFKKGQSGNSKGRPKGSKNSLTLFKEAVIKESEQLVLQDWQRVVKKTVELAQEGDTACLKLLWDRMVPAQKAQTGDTKKGTGGINIIIKGMEAKLETNEVVEAEFEEINTEEK